MVAVIALLIEYKLFITRPAELIPSPSPVFTPPPVAEILEEVANPTEDAPLPNLGSAHIQVSRPKGQDCSDNEYDVSVTVQEPPEEGRTLWLVLLLHARADLGRPNALHFAKGRINTRPGIYELHVRPSGGSSPVAW